MRFFALLLLFSPVAVAQSTTSTSGSCSPIAPNNSGNITIQCPGMSADQAKKMAAILNKILANQLDPDAVMKMLESTGKSVEEIHKQEEFSGLLTPGDEPTPPNACDRAPKRPGAMLVILGNSAALDNESPSTIIRINGEPILVMGSE